MKKLLSVFLFSCSFVLLTFLLLSDLEQEMLRFLESAEHKSGYVVISFLVLLSDILLPVPSSLVMILNGKILGPLGGALLSLSSGLLSSIIGFYLGRKGKTLFRRFYSAREMAAGNRLFKRYGKVSVSISKALPVVSEAVSFLAGTTSISFRLFFLYSFIGHSVVALVYGYIGSMTNAYNSSLVSALMIGAALLIAWMVQALAVREERVPQ